MIILEPFLQMNYSDLSPNYSGFLMSIGNTVASIPGFVAPLVTGIITEDNASLNLIKFPSICDLRQFFIAVDNCSLEKNIHDCCWFLHHPLHHIYNLWKGQSATIRLLRKY